MDKFISTVKGIAAVCSGLVATFGTGADYHNPVTWLAGLYAVEQALNSVFHWQQGS